MKKRIILGILLCLGMTMGSNMITTNAATSPTCGNFDNIAYAEKGTCICKDEDKLGDQSNKSYSNLNSEMNIVNKYYSKEEQESYSIYDNHICYSDGDTVFKIEKIRQFDTDIYLTYIKLNQAEKFNQVYSKGTVPLAGSDILYGNEPQYVNNMVKGRNAVLALNSAGFDTANPVQNLGVPAKGPTGINGSVDHVGAASSVQYMYLKEDGEMVVKCGITKPEETKQELLNANTQYILGFGPTLFSEDPKICGKINTLLDTTHTVNTTRANRTAIGQRRTDGGKNEFLIVVTDGRTNENAGLKPIELSLLFAERGYTKAYNLDGGGSSTLVYDGLILNKPVGGNGKVQARELYSALYIEGKGYNYSNVYTVGNAAVYNDQIFKAKSWIAPNAAAPDKSVDWFKRPQMNEDGYYIYQSGSIYIKNDCVVYNGKTYRAQWWTNSTPGTDASWICIE